ncbi:ribonuclease H-like domain-containing protein [Tanacetum coccineum]
MAKHVELNKKKGKGTGQEENRPVWNNVRRLNHQNKFVPKAILTKTGIFPVNIARQNLSSQTATTSTARKVNTARPIVNDIRQRNNFYKSHSPIRRPFNKSTAPKANFTKHKVNTAGDKTVNAVGGYRKTIVKTPAYDPQKALKNKGIVDSGCSRHMTGNKTYLVEYQDYNGGPIAFRGSKGQITGKGKIITRKLDFEDVYFVKELKQFNLLSALQMCDKKNKVLFTYSECLVLSLDFKLPDENQVLLRVPRQNNMYSFKLENIVPSGGLACFIAKATVDKSNKWHRRLGHVNFKNLNKLVKGNNVIEFKNMDIIEFCRSKGIKREYSNARTPQQNGVAKRKNMTLIEAARTMLADSFLPTLLEAEPAQEYFVLPLWSSYTSTVKSSEAKNGDEKPNGDIGPKINEETKDQEDQAFLEELKRLKRQDIYDNPSDGIFTNASYDDEGAVADFTNLKTTVNVSLIPTSRIHSIHHTTQILEEPTSAVQTRSKVNKSSGTHAFVSYIQKQRRNNYKDFQHCLFACFLSQIEPKKISQALEDES